MARVELVSDSAKLRITSRNDGTDPVVIALILGIVIVGGLALEVNGSASPERIKLGRDLLARKMLLDWCRRTFVGM